MSIRRKLGLFGYMVLLLGSSAQARDLCTAEPGLVGLSSTRLARIDQAMEAYVQDGNAAGVVTYVARAGRIVQQSGYGMADIEANVPMQPDTLFRMASMTKPLTSVAALILLEQGRLTLEDLVEKYLPEFGALQVAVPQKDGGVILEPVRRPITIRDLMTHTSGIPYGYGASATYWTDAELVGGYYLERNEPMSSLVRRMAALPTDAQPGEHFVYGHSTDILGVIVEQLSGQNLDQFFKAHIFEPLGMHDSQFYLPASKARRLAAVYSATAEGLTRANGKSPLDGQGHFVDGPRKVFSGGAGLVSTAADYGRFAQMLLNEGELDGVRILSPAGVRLLRSNHVGDLFAKDIIPPKPGMGFGLGVAITVDPGAAAMYESAGSYGFSGAYFTNFWIDPDEQLVMIVLTQLRPLRDPTLHTRFRNLVYQAVTESVPDHLAACN